MMRLESTGLLDLGDQQLDYRFVGPQPDEAPTLVLLHEGLGSAGLWLDFPQKLSDATGCGVFAYSRAGYGASSAIELPRPLTYMHDEARDVLPRLLDAIGLKTGILIGHSDGASITAIFAGLYKDERIKAISLMAPHFFTEDFALKEIRVARDLYEQGDLKRKLARWHTHVDCAFYGWNSSWIHPGFKDWNLTGFIPNISVPVQLIQGENDLYGTVAHVDVVVEKANVPTQKIMLENCGHSPYREAPEATLAALKNFARAHLKIHEQETQ